MRRKRFERFRALVEPLPKPISILDIGGTTRFWESMGLDLSDFAITLLNYSVDELAASKLGAITSVVGDACQLPFKSSSFDVVFSNSVIEHVGEYPRQQEMGTEVMRVGKRYFIQTPNKYFPIEPHYLFPFFQFLPVWLRAYLRMHLQIGWGPKPKSYEEATRNVGSVRLLSVRRMKKIFPGVAHIYGAFLWTSKVFLFLRWLVGSDL